MASSRFTMFLVVGAAVGVLGGATIAFVMSGDRKPVAAVANAASGAPPTAPVAPGASNGVTAVGPISAPSSPSSPPSPAPSAIPSTPTPERAAHSTVVAATKPVVPAKTPDELYEAGKALVLADKSAQAEPMLRQAFARSKEPKHGFVLAMAIFEQGRFTEALDTLRLSDRNVMTERVKQQYEKLEAKIRKECADQKLDCAASSSAAAASNPGTTVADKVASLNESGKSEMYAGKFPDAAKLFEAALLLDPGSETVRFNLATVRFQLGMFDDANFHIKRILATTKDGTHAAKAQKLMDSVYAECKRQNIQCQ